MRALGRRSGRAAVAFLVAVSLFAAHPSETASGAPRVKVLIKEIAPGLTLTRYIDKKTPLRTYVLTVDLSQPLTMDVAVAHDRLSGAERVSGMAARHGAIAAVNGDFGGSGGPVHPFAEDGDLVRTSVTPGIGFAVTADEQSVNMASPQQSVTGVESDPGEQWNVDRWNDGPPGLGEIAGFSPEGGKLEIPPAFSCSARLFPTGPPQLRNPDPGVQTDYTVESTACSAGPLTRNGGIVLSALPGTDEAQRILSLSPGETVTVTWSFGWTNVLDSIGGVPLLVSDGQIVLGSCTSSICHRHPRTGVGATADGKLLLVVVDGRRPKRWSVGITLQGFARLFLSLGAVEALNLDGGGSSTMVVNGEVINRPSQAGGERAVSSALLVLPGPDPGEAGLGALAPARPAPAGSGSRSAWRAAYLDPGSTGGMLDALARGELGFGAVRLPADLLRIVRRFRALR